MMHVDCEREIFVISFEAMSVIIISCIFCGSSPSFLEHFESNCSPSSFPRRLNGHLFLLAIVFLVIIYFLIKLNCSLPYWCLFAVL